MKQQQHTKTYKLPIYLTRRQTRLLNRYFGACDVAYNYCVDRMNESLAAGEKIPSWAALDKEFRQIKPTRFPFMDKSHETGEFRKNGTPIRWVDRNRIPETILNQKFADFGEAIDNYFNKSMKDHELPKRKNKNRKRKSCRFNIRTDKPNQKCWVSGQTLKLSLLGEIKVKWGNRTIAGTPRTATIVKEATGHYFVCLAVTEDIIQTKPTGKAIGADAGARTSLTLSEGTIKLGEWKDVEAIIENFNAKIARLNEIIKIKKKNSANYKKFLTKRAKLYRRRTNVIHDRLHKISLDLVREFDVIAIEDLSVSSMLAGSPARARNKKIAASAMKTLLMMIEYKAIRHGKVVIKCDPAFTSKMCSGCQSINYDLGKASRWVCPTCGLFHDRDSNAAKNILQKSDLNHPVGVTGLLKQTKIDWDKESKLQSI